MSARSPIEERLRAAFDARARLISAHDLSPARPPTGRAWGTRRIRRVLSAVAVTAAAAAAAIAFLLPSGSDSGSPERRHHPAPPAGDPAVTPRTPEPVPTPGEPRSRPSPSQPR